MNLKLAEIDHLAQNWNLDLCYTTDIMENLGFSSSARLSLFSTAKFLNNKKAPH